MPLAGQGFHVSRSQGSQLLCFFGADVVALPVVLGGSEHLEVRLPLGFLYLTFDEILFYKNEVLLTFRLQTTVAKYPTRLRKKYQSI